MKSETLYRALGDVGEDLIESAARPRRQTNTWTKWAALAACCALILGIAVLGLPDWGAKSVAPEAADMARGAEESAELEMSMDSPAAQADDIPAEAEEAPAEASAAKAPAEKPAEAPAEAPAGDAEETADLFLGRSYLAVSFQGCIYEPAGNNDPGHTAGESDGEAAGALLGVVDASPTEALVGTEVYAYDGFDASEYILVKDESRTDPWVLYRAVN